MACGCDAGPKRSLVSFPFVPVVGIPHAPLLGNPVSVPVKRSVTAATIAIPWSAWSSGGGRRIRGLLGPQIRPFLAPVGAATLWTAAIRGPGRVVLPAWPAGPQGW